MLPSGDIYNSERVAAAYAFARPPVHPLVVRRMAGHATFERRPVSRALDVGCGAGRSTAALASVARSVVGIEPAAPMLVHHRAVAPRASFVVGRAEALPFPPGSFDLVTAAGSLNYTDAGRSLAEIARVLVRGGALVIYDFSSGRRSSRAPSLESWFSAFEHRYPFPSGYAMDVERLPYDRAGLRLAGYEPFEIAVPLTFEAYLAYVLSEANVERAIVSGVPEPDIAAWCRETLARVFGAASLPVLFNGYIAYVAADAAPPA
jgi:SAM-dependent methyltransferase